MIAKSTGFPGPAGERAHFPRSARLLKPIDFKRVFEKNVVSMDPFFRIIARPSGQGEARLGLAVSRKVDKHAVGRNRIKRIVRESFRRHAGVGENGLPALDFVVLARPAAASICNDELYRSLEHHWLAIARKALKRFPGNRQSEGRE